MSPRPTTFIEASHLLPESEIRLVLACETFQHTGSFKYRAAYQVASNVSQSHIIGASSGNFGQALALACKVFSKRCTVVMPETSAQVKIDAVKSYGAEVDLIDVSKQSRDSRVADLAKVHPNAYITSAFDDQWVISGNATLGTEILKRLPEAEWIVAPIGGGGLTSGLILATRQAKSGVKVLAAEPLLGNDAAQSFRAGAIVANSDEPKTIADGARTRSVGHLNWEILHSEGGLSDVVEVPEEGIGEAMRTLFLRCNLKCEPTGALAVAAALMSVGRFSKGGTVCCIVSGGNVDPAVYVNIILGK